MARNPFEDYPDASEMMGRWRQRLTRLSGWTGWLVVLVIIGFWAAGGIYSVGPAEFGLVKRFGEYTRSTNPGLHYHLPAPFESVVIVNARSVRKEEIGFRTVSTPPNPQYREMPAEALMLTGDGNIVWVDTVIQYQVKGPESFAFNVVDATELMRMTTEAILREEVAKRTLDQVLTVERDAIGLEAQDQLQALLDGYGVGIDVVNIKIQDSKPPQQVAAAFDDVNSARQDKETRINEGERYRNDILPRARGDAEQILQAAEAYKAERVAEAEGDVARFNDVLEQYRVGDQSVTINRLYIETLEQVLPNLNVLVLSESAAGEGAFKFLDLSSLMDRRENDGGGNQ